MPKRVARLKKNKYVRKDLDDDATVGDRKRCLTTKKKNVGWTDKVGNALPVSQEGMQHVRQMEN
jgi:hypothetical protein